VYGYADSTWRPTFGREETLDFVRNTLALAYALLPQG